MIIANVVKPDGTEVQQMKRVYSISNNMALMEDYNQLSRDVCAKKQSLAEAENRYHILSTQKRYPLYLTVLGGALGSGGFCVMFGGGLLDFMPAFLVGALMSYLNEVLSIRSFNSYARAFMLSVIGGFFSITLCYLLQLIGLTVSPAMVMKGTIMVVIPGVLICNAIRDLFAGDIFSGSSQLLNGVLTALVIVAGYGAAVYILRGILVEPTYPVRTGVIKYVYLVIFGIIGSAAFAVFFKIRLRRIGFATLAILLTYALYLVMDYYAESVFAVTLVATIFAALCSEILARIIKAPATVFLIPAILPFVPGAGLYDTISYIVQGELSTAWTYGGQVVLYFLGIAVGLSVVASIFQLIYPVKNRIHIVNRYKSKEKLKKKRGNH
jgi:uncharacterized membrane protein YjjP (DUF1212 family)